MSTTPWTWMPALLQAAADHLWGSTLVVGAVWLLALTLRRHRAQVRYALWLAASAKFAAGALAMAAPVAIGVVTAPRLAAQAQAAAGGPANAPAFEVASIRPNDSGTNQVRIGIQPGGRFNLFLGTGTVGNNQLRHAMSIVRPRLRE